MNKQEYDTLLNELEDIKSEWENKSHITKLDMLKFYLKYLGFYNKINRFRTKDGNKGSYRR